MSQRRNISPPRSNSHRQRLDDDNINNAKNHNPLSNHKNNLSTPKSPKYPSSAPLLQPHNTIPYGLKHSQSQKQISQLDQQMTPKKQAHQHSQPFFTPLKERTTPRRRNHHSEQEQQQQLQTPQSTQKSRNKTLSSSLPPGYIDQFIRDLGPGIELSLLFTCLGEYEVLQKINDKMSRTKTTLLTTSEITHLQQFIFDNLTTFGWIHPMVFQELIRLGHQFHNISYVKLEPYQVHYNDECVPTRRCRARYFNTFDLSHPQLNLKLLSRATSRFGPFCDGAIDWFGKERGLCRCIGSNEEDFPTSQYPFITRGLSRGSFDSSQDFGQLIQHSFPNLIELELTDALDWSLPWRKVGPKPPFFNPISTITQPFLSTRMEHLTLSIQCFTPNEIMKLTQYANFPMLCTMALWENDERGTMKQQSFRPALLPEVCVKKLFAWWEKMQFFHVFDLDSDNHSGINVLDVTFAKCLAQSSILTRLKTLLIWWDDSPPFYQSLGEEEDDDGDNLSGLDALLSSPNFAHNSKLILYGFNHQHYKNHINNAILTQPGLQKLVSIKTKDCLAEGMDDFFSAMAISPHLTNIKAFSFIRSAIHNESVFEHFMHSFNMSQVIRLHIKELKGEDFITLSRSPNLGQLTTLVVDDWHDGHSLDPASMKLLASLPLFYYVTVQSGNGTILWARYDPNGGNNDHFDMNNYTHIDEDGTIIRSNRSHDFPSSFYYDEEPNTSQSSLFNHSFVQHDDYLMGEGDPQFSHDEDGISYQRNLNNNHFYVNHHDDKEDESVDANDHHNEQEKEALFSSDEEVEFSPNEEEVEFSPVEEKDTTRPPKTSKYMAKHDQNEQSTHKNTQTTPNINETNSISQTSSTLSFNSDSEVEFSQDPQDDRDDDEVDFSADEDNVEKNCNMNDDEVEFSPTRDDEDNESLFDPFSQKSNVDENEDLFSQVAPSLSQYLDDIDSTIPQDKDLKEEISNDEQLFDYNIGEDKGDELLFSQTPQLLDLYSPSFQHPELSSQSNDDNVCDVNDRLNSTDDYDNHDQLHSDDDYNKEHFVTQSDQENDEVEFSQNLFSQLESPIDELFSDCDGGDNTNDDETLEKEEEDGDVIFSQPTHHNIDLSDIEFSQDQPSFLYQLSSCDNNSNDDDNDDGLFDQETDELLFDNDILFDQNHSVRDDITSSPVFSDQKDNNEQMIAFSPTLLSELNESEVEFSD